MLSAVDFTSAVAIVVVISFPRPSTQCGSFSLISNIVSEFEGLNMPVVLSEIHLVPPWMGRRACCSKGFPFLEHARSAKGAIEPGRAKRLATLDRCYALGFHLYLLGG